jgi:O-antigen ligase
MILLGLWLLLKRRFDLPRFAGQNVWTCAFLAYCLLSIGWSDFPFVAFKRWIKILGHPVMALVILSERDPLTAVRQVLKRLSFLLIPLSVVLIKYYPHVGRGFDQWSGLGFNRGATLNKNELGYGCLIFGLFFVWNLFVQRRIRNPYERRYEFLISIGFLGLILWLLRQADSATCIACFALGIGVMAVIQSPFIANRRFMSWFLAASAIGLAAEYFFGVYDFALGLLGRDSNLTDRTELWADLLAFPVNRVLGAGFESFWLGQRLDVLWEKWWWQPNQAHNGYIETYVNLGIVGVLLLGAWIVSALRKADRSLERDVIPGMFRIALLIVILAYNYTEAAFKGVHFIWTMFFLVSMDYRPLRLATKVREPVRRGGRRGRVKRRPGGVLLPA